MANNIKISQLIGDVDALNKKMSETAGILGQLIESQKKLKYFNPTYKR